MDNKEIIDDVNKYWLKSKTIVFNGIVVFGGLISDNLDFIKTSIPAKYVLLALGVVGLMNILLRFKTDKPITTTTKEVKDDNISPN